MGVWEIVLVGLAISMFAVSTTISAVMQPRESRRLARIDAKLDLILQHLGIEFVDPAIPSDMSEEVKNLAERGQKIEAIKVLRADTGMGLKDAKDAVDAYLETVNN